MASRRLDQFETVGRGRIKVDFMQRDDQRVVNYYYRVAREGRARHLLVDFHGAHKPAGLNRTWPNVLTFEGVHGLENNKWTDDVTPTHNVTLPFTRMLAGPMDYTPGAMINATAGELPRHLRPADEHRHADAPAGDVRGVREPAADARRQPVGVRARARRDGVAARGAGDMGRDACCSTAPREPRARGTRATARTGSSAR
jgi:hypothetical protein